MRIGLLLLLVFACSVPANDETMLLHGAAQGTTYHVKFVAPAKDFDSKQLQDDIEKTLAQIDRQMSTYRPDSEISRFNRLRADEWFAVSRAVAEVVAASREISKKTGGAQDITVGPLVWLWHFGPKDSASGVRKRDFRLPSDDEIAASRERVGFKKLDVRV